MSLPWWKLRREIGRLGAQAIALPPELARRLYFRRWYDLVTARKIELTPGAVPLGAEAGIYLVFPSQGILPSHLHMLEEMRSQGIAPIVVSNLPLSAPDRDRLRPLVARIVERPNVGYDFGGYRDAVLGLAQDLPRLERLWLLNDSAWLVPQPASWFAEARALGTDFMAATSNYAMPRVDPERFRDITWDHSTGHRNFHYASYALGFGPRILRDRAFLRYWRGLDIRNDKTRTVRRGEIGLSQWVISRGYSHRATCEVDRLDAELAALPDAEIDRIAQDLVIPDDAALEAIKAEVLARDPSSETGRAERIALILATVSRRASAYALPGYSLRHGFQFLKKSPLWLSPEAAVVMMRIIGQIEGPVGEQIQAEAKSLLRKDVQDAAEAERRGG